VTRQPRLTPAALRLLEVRMRISRAVLAQVRAATEQSTAAITVKAAVTP